MTNDIAGRDRVSGDDRRCQFGQRRHLRSGERVVSVLMPPVDQFNADGTAVHIGMPAPVGDAGMPGAPGLRDQP